MRKDQGKYEQAEEMFRQALRLRETVLGKEHPDTLTSMYNLAYVLSNRKRFSEASALYQKGTKRLRKNFNPGSSHCPFVDRSRPVRSLSKASAISPLQSSLICVSMVIIESFLFPTLGRQSVECEWHFIPSVLNPCANQIKQQSLHHGVSPGIRQKHHFH